MDENEILKLIRELSDTGRREFYEIYGKEYGTNLSYISIENIKNMILTYGPKPFYDIFEFYNEKVKEHILNIMSLKDLVELFNKSPSFESKLEIWNMLTIFKKKYIVKYLELDIVDFAAELLKERQYAKITSLLSITQLLELIYQSTKKDQAYICLASNYNIKKPLWKSLPLYVKKDIWDNFDYYKKLVWCLVEWSDKSPNIYNHFYRKLDKMYESKIPSISKVDPSKSTLCFGDLNRVPSDGKVDEYLKHLTELEIQNLYKRIKLLSYLEIWDKVSNYVKSQIFFYYNDSIKENLLKDMSLAEIKYIYYDKQHTLVRKKLLINLLSTNVLYEWYCSDITGFYKIWEYIIDKRGVLDLITPFDYDKGWRCILDEHERKIFVSLLNFEEVSKLMNKVSLDDQLRIYTSLSNEYRLRKWNVLSRDTREMFLWMMSPDQKIIEKLIRLISH